jgi:hypothetical protein
MAALAFDDVSPAPDAISAGLKALIDIFDFSSSRKTQALVELIPQLLGVPPRLVLRIPSTGR